MRLTVASSLVGAALIVAAGAVAPGHDSTAPGRRADARAASGATGHRARTAVEIYPTAERLPENLLRVYLVFDTPMAAGESGTRLRLLDDRGRAVERAFLHLGEELWDPSGRRLTVLFDPGRIKRGLRANLESGPPLTAGRRYRLVVAAGWPDRHGRPLGLEVAKAFAVGPADRTRPDPAAWLIDAPAAETLDALAVRVGETLDRALLASALRIVDEAGRPVPGTIEVARGEAAWRFVPERPWPAGRYAVQISPELEDVAGNSLTRLFDADLTRAAPAAAVVTSRPFAITRRLAVTRNGS